MGENTTATTALPIHLVTNVLEHLDNLEDLGSALSGSDVCRSAFDDHGKAIIRGIIRNMISPESLPYAVLMTESKRGEHMDLDTAKAFMSRYPAALEDPNYAATTLRGFSMSTLLDLGETYKVVDSMASDYIRRAPDLPGYFERIHPSLNRRAPYLQWHSETIDPASIRRAAELCKVQRNIIERALLRYEIFRNICLPQQPGAMTQHIAETFLSAHLPLVNVEMRCMFKYLLFRLHEGMQFFLCTGVSWVENGLTF